MIPIMGESRVGARGHRVSLSMSTGLAKIWLQVFSLSKTDCTYIAWDTQKDDKD
jgi:hypothetical protein